MVGIAICWRWLLAFCVALSVAVPAQAQDNANVAPGFTGLPKDAKLVITPVDVELFVVTAGGMLEPKADWTDAAQKHMRQALHDRAKGLGVGSNELAADQADQMSELLSLHGAVAQSIAIHHNTALKLPTKDGKLDWSFGDNLRPLQQATGARYALFTWVRDSYASAERVAMMIGLAILGVGVGGGAQVGYASLVDLETGQVLWFNRLRRAGGDLREASKATETVQTLLSGFPAVKP